MKETAAIDIIDKNIWLNYFTKLWTHNETLTTCTISNNDYVECFTMEELNLLLSNSTNNKAPGEVVKYYRTIQMCI